MARQATPFIPQFQLPYHAALTEQACPDNPTIRSQLPAIVAGNLATDLNQFESALHFDNCAFPPGVERIEDLWQLIRAGEVVDRYVTFGTMIHTVQDFYAHSNWVELHQDQDPVPTWDLHLSTLPPAIVSGVFALDFPKLCGPGAPSHAQLNKDSPDSEEGAKVVTSGPNQGRTLFDLAFAGALAATRTQYALLVAVVGE